MAPEGKQGGPGGTNRAGEKKTRVVAWCCGVGECPRASEAGEERPVQLRGVALLDRLQVADGAAGEGLHVGRGDGADAVGQGPRQVPVAAEEQGAGEQGRLARNTDLAPARNVGVTGSACSLRTSWSITFQVVFGSTAET
jgi:hypothetical protein